MGARHVFLPTSLLLGSLCLAAGAGCAKSDSVGDTFQNLGGSGGNGVGGGSEGGAGAGVTTTETPTSETTTSSAGTTGTTTSSTTSDTTTTTTTPTCSDGPNEGEPNNSEATAKNLGAISDDDNDGESINGVLTGSGDVDWFRYSGLDEFGNVVDPTRLFNAMGSIRLCKFVQCKSPPQDPYVCPGGSTPETSPDGRLGCCAFGNVVYSSNPFSAEAFNCKGTDDGADIYIRVDNPNGLECVPYSVDYHF